MRRNRPALLVLILGLLLLPAAIALGGPEKEFSKFGFKWSLPDGWSFGSSSPDEVNGGFVAKAECGSASIEAWIYTSPTNDLSVGERVADVKSNGAEGLGTVSQTKVIDSSLSGIKGKAVVMDVRSDGLKGHFRTYVISANGKFYQLILRAWHEAEKNQVAEINALRKGFRLLKGAGGEDKDEALDEFGGSGDSDDDDDGSDDDSDGEHGSNGGSDPNWPRGGAQKEGRTVKLPTHNVEWTLPEGPFQWVGAPTAEKEENGLFVSAMGKVERKAKEEYEKDRPPSVVRLDLIIMPSNPGVELAQWVRDGAKVGRAGKPIWEAWGIFDGQVDSNRSATFEDKKIGNVRGVIMKREGKSKGKRCALVLFMTTLRGEQYRIRAIATGADDVYRHMIKDIANAVKGIKFLDTSEPQAGPLLGIATTYNWTRGEKVDKEKAYRGPGYTFKKPEGMAMLMTKHGRHREVRFSGEWRNEAKDAYLYLEIRTYKYGQRGKPDPKPEKYVNERAEEWMAGAGDRASVGRKKGEIGRKGSFGKAKGLTYEFTGHLGDAPFTEKGYVVKHKQILLNIRMQYGGVDAEKKLKKMIKTVKKGIKLSK